MYMYTIRQYTNELQNDIINFWENVLPESGRKLDLDGRHNFLCIFRMYMRNFGAYTMENV